MLGLGIEGCAWSHTHHLQLPVLKGQEVGDAHTTARSGLLNWGSRDPQDHFGWRRPLRPLTPTTNSTKHLNKE